MSDDANATADQTVTINISGSNDAPVITAGPDTASLTEANTGLSTSGTLTVSDIDRTDLVTATRTLAVSGSSDRSDPAAPSDSDLLAMFSLDASTSSAILDATEQSDTLSWSFNSGTEAFDYLEDGDTLVLTYTVTATDDDSTPLSDSETVTITITGTNDAPVITNGADAASLTETDTTLATNGSFDVTDADTKDLVSATVSSVALSGTFTTSGSTLPSALSDNSYGALIDMLDLTIASGSTGTDSATDQTIDSLDANTATSGSTVDWAFTSGSSGDSSFDFLQEGETLTLTYTLTLQDDSGVSSSDSETTTVAITITGTNDSPVITNGDDTSALTETNTSISDTDTMTVTDIDLTDTIDVSVDSVAISGGSYNAADVPLTNDQLKAMLGLRRISNYLNRINRST